MIHRKIAAVWRNKIPAVFFALGGGLIVSQAIDRYLMAFPAYFDRAWLGIGLGSFYLVLGGLWLWTNRAERRLNEQMQQHRKLIEQMDTESEDQ
jgi:hypothetical protein